MGAVNNWANLGEISNSIAIWLGISPPDLFFYAFLPPLLVDSAIRIDFFMFSKVRWCGPADMHAGPAGTAPAVQCSAVQCSAVQCSVWMRVGRPLL